MIVYITIASILLFFILLIIFFLLYLHLSTRNVRLKGKRILENLDKTSPYRKPLETRRPNNKLYAKVKDKQKEQDLIENLDASLQTGIQKYNEKEIDLNELEESVEIIGIAKPVGFWSRFIMNQKLKFIVARINTQRSSKRGFWVNFIKAQSMSQGKNQARGR